MSSLQYKLGELADIVGGKIEGDADVEIDGVAGIREARSGQITFLANPKYEAFLDTTRASAVIGSPDLKINKPLIKIENPYLAYLKVLNLFADQLTVQYPREVHEQVIVDDSAVLGNNVAVGPFCQICAGVRIGDNTTILAGVFVGEKVEIGADCLIYPSVTIRE